MATDETEKDIQNKILIDLQQHIGGLWYRRNVGAMKGADGTYVKFGIPGQADIVGIVRGMSVEIEVKSANGRQAPRQKDWQVAVERAGGIYILTRSADDAILQTKDRLCKIKSINSDGTYTQKD